MMRLAGLLLALICTAAGAAAQSPPAPGSIRIASFNTALAQKGAGLLVRLLEEGGNRQVDGIARIILSVRPDILLVQEFDHDMEGRALDAFAGILAAGRAGLAGIAYPHRLAWPVNTGERSGLDLDGDGRDYTAADAFGFGAFPGQYGMAVLSRLPLMAAESRSFRLLRWAEFPGARLPMRADGTPFPSAEAQAAMRLSSKSHWDLRVALPGGGRLALFVSHPTPPVFDDEHDLNGRRNADEIAFWQLYIEGEPFTDDTGAIAPRADIPFVVMGDLNSDPDDGDSIHEAIRALLSHPLLQDPRPASPGAVAAAQDAVNRAQKGDPALDTGDFREKKGPGNLRVDYVLPARSLKVTGAGVFWPAPGAPLHELVAGGVRTSSDHRLVWVDIALP